MIEAADFEGTLTLKMRKTQDDRGFYRIGMRLIKELSKDLRKINGIKTW